MYAPLQAEPIDEALQLIDERGVGAFEHRRIVVVGDFFSVFEQVTALVGEVDGVRPTVLGVAFAAGETALLEVVDQADHHVAVDVQPLGESLLGEALVGGEVGEHAELAGGDAERFQAPGELGGDMKSQLRKQEARSACQIGHGRYCISK